MISLKRIKIKKMIEIKKINLLERIRHILLLIIYMYIDIR